MPFKSTSFINLKFILFYEDIWLKKSLKAPWINITIVTCICNVEQRGQYESQAAHWVVAFVQPIRLQIDLYKVHECPDYDQTKFKWVIISLHYGWYRNIIYTFTKKQFWADFHFVRKTRL